LIERKNYEKWQYDSGGGKEKNVIVCKVIQTPQMTLILDQGPDQGLVQGQGHVPDLSRIRDQNRDRRQDLHLGPLHLKRHQINGKIWRFEEDQIIVVHLQTGEVTDLTHHRGSSEEILEDQSNIVDIKDDQGIMREKGKNPIVLDVAEARVEKVGAIMEETTVVVVAAGAGDEEVVVDQMKGGMATGITMETITENGLTIEIISKENFPVGTTITSQGTLVENMRAIKDETITMLETKRAVVVVVITSLVVVAVNKDLVEKNRGSTESKGRETPGSSGIKENMAAAAVVAQEEGIPEEIIKVPLKAMELKNKGMMDG